MKGYDPPKLRKRDPGGIANTTYVGEVVDVVNKLAPMLRISSRAEKAPPWRTPIIPGKIINSTGSSANKWTYSIQPQILTTSGFQDDPESTPVSALNGMEANNSLTGVQGCGVNVSTLPPGFALQPIGNGAVVDVHIRIAPDGSQLYWFSKVNQVDGSCT